MRMRPSCPSSCSLQGATSDCNCLQHRWGASKHFILTVCGKQCRLSEIGLFLPWWYFSLRNVCFTAHLNVIKLFQSSLSLLLEFIMALWIQPICILLFLIDSGSEDFHEYVTHTVTKTVWHSAWMAWWKIFGSFNIWPLRCFLVKAFMIAPAARWVRWNKEVF